MESKERNYTILLLSVLTGDFQVFQIREMQKKHYMILTLEIRYTCRWIDDQAAKITIRHHKETRFILHLFIIHKCLPRIDYSCLTNRLKK